MAEQLALAEAPPAPPPAPSAWVQVRAARQGVRLIRLIELDRGEQRFVHMPPDASDFLEGATVIRPSIPGGRSPEEFNAIVAEYNRRWQEEHPA